ncbi:hypothetical protein MTR67_043440 [Solanum verrucosum]|uniref:Uncharacterized protein n=1 Tax=Solanum verrucosum TaxID=315347 RepID=A0AAF0UQA0_SOLVR|nr:hypothetical protein MTR67_043440 [Solanum verrucosum]
MPIGGVEIKPIHYFLELENPYHLLKVKDTIQEVVYHFPSGPSHVEHFTKMEMKGYMDNQKKQVEPITILDASLDMLERDYVNLAKTYATLQQDFIQEIEKSKKKGKFIVKM